MFDLADLNSRALYFCLSMDESWFLHDTKDSFIMKHLSLQEGCTLIFILYAYYPLWVAI